MSNDWKFLDFERLNSTIIPKYRYGFKVGASIFGTRRFQFKHHRAQFLHFKFIAKQE